MAELAIADQNDRVLYDATQARIDDFKRRVLVYKSQNKLTIGQLANECDLNPSTIENVISRNGRKSMLLETALMISMGLGIEF